MGGGDNRCGSELLGVPVNKLVTLLRYTSTLTLWAHAALSGEGKLLSKVYVHIPEQMQVLTQW